MELTLLPVQKSPQNAWNDEEKGLCWIQWEEEGAATQHTMYQAGFVWEVKHFLLFQSALGLEDSAAAFHCSF